MTKNLASGLKIGRYRPRPSSPLPLHAVLAATPFTTKTAALHRAARRRDEPPDVSRAPSPAKRLPYQEAATGRQKQGQEGDYGGDGLRPGLGGEPDKTATSFVCVGEGSGVWWRRSRAPTLEWRGL